MKTHLLVTAYMLPVPSLLRVKADWGRVDVHVDGGGFVHGDHMLIEGSEKDFIAWLKKFDGVWVGEGNPQAQVFNVCHVKEPT